MEGKPSFGSAAKPPRGNFQGPPRTAGGVTLCGACRRAGACRLGLTKERVDDEGVTHFELACPPDGEGAPRVAHGGWTSGVLDEVLGHVPGHYSQLAVTATLTVNFLQPVPIEHPLRARAWVDRVEGKKWFISGELTLASSGAVLANATGLWVAREFGEHFKGFREWLAQQERGDES